MSVLSFTGVTTADIPVANVVGAAAQTPLSEVVIIGTDADGLYFAASIGAPERVLWLIEMVKISLMADTEDTNV